MLLRTALVLLCATMVCLTPRFVLAQSEVDIAMKFFLQGGTYCFRVAPEGTNLSEETQWTVMMLTGSENHRNEFRIRSVDPGATKLSGRALTEVGLDVTAIWRRERVRDEFFDRYAAAISGGMMRARVTTLAPPGLASMSERDRAEVYLKFADKGTKVDFSKSPDLTADGFLEYRTYSID